MEDRQNRAGDSTPARENACPRGGFFSKICVIDEARLLQFCALSEISTWDKYVEAANEKCINLARCIQYDGCASEADAAPPSTCT